MVHLHPGAWVTWVGAVLVALSITRNPLYVLLILACMAVVAAVLRPQSKAPLLPLSPLRFGLLIVLFSAVFNGLTAHFGQTVLLSLPAGWPLLGGPVTLEALVYGTINGLVLAGFLAAFTVLNMALPTYALIRLIPRAFYPMAVVISIAVAFVPTTLQQFQQIREAQMVRGHQVRGLRDWLPLLMPLFVSGLERAFQLAEAMTARGFAAHTQAEPGGNDQGISRGLPSLGLVVGLLAAMVGLLLRLLGLVPELSLGLLAASAGLVFGALWLLGRSVKRTSYQHQRWGWQEGAVIAGSALVVIVYLVPLPFIGREALFYTPYPKLSLPPFDAILALATLALLVPALLLASRPVRRAKGGLPDATPAGLTSSSLR